MGKRFCGDYCSDSCEPRISDVFFCGGVAVGFVLGCVKGLDCPKLRPKLDHGRIHIDLDLGSVLGSWVIGSWVISSLLSRLPPWAVMEPGISPKGGKRIVN